MERQVEFRQRAAISVLSELCNKVVTGKANSQYSAGLTGQAALPKVLQPFPLASLPSVGFFEHLPVFLPSLLFCLYLCNLPHSCNEDNIMKPLQPKTLEESHR